MNLNKYEKLRQNIIRGKDQDKIQAISIKKENGEYILQYTDNGKDFNRISCETRDELDKLLIEFKGKNLETCSAPDQFLQLDNTWGSGEIHSRGHRIEKISLTGQKIVRNDENPIEIPDNCGTLKTTKSSKGKKKNKIKFMIDEKEGTNLTCQFGEGQEFDNLIEFINDHTQLSRLTWYVRFLCTQSRKGEHCVWKRLRAGDGTKRMVLELVELNGVPYTECIRGDLFDAADDMLDNVCQRITLKKKRDHTMEICMFAAEDGKIDISQYEVN